MGNKSQISELGKPSHTKNDPIKEQEGVPLGPGNSLHQIKMGCFSSEFVFFPDNLNCPDNMAVLVPHRDCGHDQPGALFANGGEKQRCLVAGLNG